MKYLLGLALLFFATVGHATGEVSLKFKAQGSFFKIEVTEESGYRSGLYTSLGGRAPLSAEIVDDRLSMFFGNAESWLNIDTADTKSNYRGYFAGIGVTRIEVWQVAGKNIRMRGNMDDSVDFEVNVDSKKGYLTLHWDTFSLELKKDKKVAGNCSGALYYDMYKVGTLSCSSSGDLKDTFFTNQIDIIAWLVQTFVSPSEKLNLTPSLKH